MIIHLIGLIRRVDNIIEGMRKILIVLTVFFMLPVWGQDIEVKDFVRNHTSMVARMNPVMDNAGEACALIRFSVRDTSFVIEANLGVLKRECKIGEIHVYVPQGTKRLTVRYRNKLPLKDYEIPEVIEQKVTYDAVIQFANAPKSADVGSHVYMGAGFNVLSIMGPSLSFGFIKDHHAVEVGAVIGLGKTDDLFFYKNGTTLKAAWNYKAMRAQARYGYVLPVADFMDVVPQGGLAMNMFTGGDVKDGGVQTDDFKKASSLSFIVAARLQFSIGSKVKVQVTPEYDFGLYKSDNCKLISENDNTFKSWTDGINLNAGIILLF